GSNPLLPEGKEVGILETARGIDDSKVIVPAWNHDDETDKTSGRSAAYIAAKHGSHTPPEIEFGHGLFYNTAFLSALNVMRPIYRKATVDSADWIENTVTVTFDKINLGAFSSAEDLPTLFLSKVCAVRYMICDARAFSAGDRVIVEFDSADWYTQANVPDPEIEANYDVAGDEKMQGIVIGFIDNPKQCPIPPGNYLMYSNTTSKLYSFVRDYETGDAAVNYWTATELTAYNGSGGVGGGVFSRVSDELQIAIFKTTDIYIVYQGVFYQGDSSTSSYNKPMLAWVDEAETLYYAACHVTGTWPTNYTVIRIFRWTGSAWTQIFTEASILARPHGLVCTQDGLRFQFAEDDDAEIWHFFTVDPGDSWSVAHTTQGYDGTITIVPNGGRKMAITHTRTGSYEAGWDVTNEGVMYSLPDGVTEETTTIDYICDPSVGTHISSSGATDEWLEVTLTWHIEGGEWTHKYKYEPYTTTIDEYKSFNHSLVQGGGVVTLEGKERLTPPVDLDEAYAPHSGAISFKHSEIEPPLNINGTHGMNIWYSSPAYSDLGQYRAINIAGYDDVIDALLMAHGPTISSFYKNGICLGGASWNGSGQANTKRSAEDAAQVVYKEIEGWYTNIVPLAASSGDYVDAGSFFDSGQALVPIIQDKTKCASYIMGGTSTSPDTGDIDGRIFAPCLHAAYDFNDDYIYAPHLIDNLDRYYSAGSWTEPLFSGGIDIDISDIDASLSNQDNWMIFGVSSN
ncbi:MAG: hypothetical protein KAS32_24845, partial [Candidatus Peribacteraceae bacterium]|nr:hypothetical protein [Candidatus Peribacteraceae bacterium]